MKNESEDIDLKTVSEVNLKEDFQSSGVADILLELDNSLIGLEPVKTRIKETASLLLVDKAREKLGLVNESPTLHMSFSGNPGTGNANPYYNNSKQSQLKAEACLGGIYHGTDANGTPVFETYEDSNAPELLSSPQCLIVLNINSFCCFLIL